MNIKKYKQKAEATSLFHKALLAAGAMDWMQPSLTQSPPCFHVCKDGRFCGRAERWHGHPDMHSFVPFQNLMISLRAAAMIEGMEEARRIIGASNPFARSPNAEIRGLCQAEIRNAIEANRSH